MNLFNPEVIVIGGGFGLAAFDQLLPGVREVVGREALEPAGDVAVVGAQLGPDAGLVGAGLIAFDAIA